MRSSAYVSLVLVVILGVSFDFTASEVEGLVIDTCSYDSGDGFYVEFGFFNVVVCDGKPNVGGTFGEVSKDYAVRSLGL